MSKKHASAAFNSHQTLVWAKYQHPNNQQVKNNKRSHVPSKRLPSDTEELNEIGRDLNQQN